MDDYEEFKENAQKSLKTGNFEWLDHIPYDPRFPNVNQTRNCLQNFVDYFRCRRLYGEDYKPCNYFNKAYRLVCPIDWINEWEKQVEQGIFPYKL